MVGEWIFQVAVKKREPAEIAQTWVVNHPKIVNEWVKGIEDLANQVGPQMTGH